MNDGRLTQIRSEWATAKGWYPAGLGGYSYEMTVAIIDNAHAAITDLLQALADAETRAAQLTRAMAEMGALAHDLAGMEHGARCEQMRAMHQLGIIATEESLAAHLARADAFTARQYERIDAARPDAGQGEG